MSFFDSHWFTYGVVPVLIFCSRICDVSIGTLRIIFVSRGQKYFAPVVGFFEVLIWLLAITKVMQNLDHGICYVAYAGGFATGNYIGMWIEEKIAMGTLMIQIVTQKDATNLVRNLKDGGYGATSVPAQGSRGLVNVVYSVIKRQDVDDVVGLIRQFNPNAFYSVQDVRFVNKGIFPSRSSLTGFSRLCRNQ
jgi:uncharacterized protein YebE (UPF0316 family)